MERNHEALKRSQEMLEKKSEELKRQIKKDLEILNDKIENNSETLLRQMKEEGEKNREELSFLLIEFREEAKQTKTGMNKRWEETSYPVGQLNETVDSDLKPWNETLDTTSEDSKEMEIVEESSVLFSEYKYNKNTEKIKRIKTNRRRVKKNRIIKKIKEPKEIGKVYKKKRTIKSKRRIGDDEARTN